MATSGMPVGLIYCNTSIFPTELPDTQPWHIEDSDGQEVYSGVALTMIIDVPPGGCLGWGWGQQDNDGNQVVAGTYYAIVLWKYEGEATWRESSAKIEVLGGISIKVDPNPVHLDSTATITLINDTPENITVPGPDPWWIEEEAPWGEPVPDGGLPLPDPQDLAPGQTMQWSWMPSDTVPSAGDYFVLMDVVDATGNVVRVAKDIVVLPPPPVSEVVWVVSPSVSPTGSCVGLTFTNATPDTVYLPDTSHWWIEDLDGNLVYAPITAFAITPVPPGVTVPWAWHERDMNDQPAPVGMYVAKTEYYTDATYTNKVEKSYYFHLVGAPAPCLFVQTDRALYSTGETVDGDFENCAPDTVGMVVSQFWWISNQIGLPVYGPYVLYVHTLYPPTTGFDITWDQKDMSGAQVPPGTYYAWVAFTDEHFLTQYVQASPPFVIGAPSGIGRLPAGDAVLEQNYPNPFNPGTEIRYWVSATAPVTVRIYDTAGRLVKTLVDEVQSPRPEGYTVSWDATNDVGERVASGVYFYRLAQAGQVTAKKMVVLK